jgi:hypothetical protein
MVNKRKRVEMNSITLRVGIKTQQVSRSLREKILRNIASEKGDVPGWVLVVLMTTGLVTAIWTIAAPRLTSILKNSLDAMNGIR